VVKYLTKPLPKAPMSATITEIAKTAKVSTGLVSRLVRNDPTLRVSDATVARIRAVEKQLGGIKINRAARSLSTGLSYNIVLPISQVYRSHPMAWPAPVLLKNLEEGIRDRDFRLSITYFDQENTLTCFQDLSESPDYCDGMILLNGIINSNLARLFLDRRLAHIVIDPDGERCNVNTVTAYAMSGIRQAIIHLQELGHRNIGFLGDERMARFPLLVAVMTERGLPVGGGLNCFLPEANVVGKTRDEWLFSVKRIFADRLKQRRQPATTAFICQNDAVAHGAVEVLRDHGLCPGRDISLVGYDNSEERGDVPSAHPILTTIDNPVDLVGRRAADTLINQILHKQHQIVHEHIPTKLIIRETTGPCVGGRQQQKG